MFNDSLRIESRLYVKIKSFLDSTHLTQPKIITGISVMNKYYSLAIFSQANLLEIHVNISFNMHFSAIGFCNGYTYYYVFKMIIDLNNYWHDHTSSV